MPISPDIKVKLQRSRKHRVLRLPPPALRRGGLAKGGAGTKKNFHFLQNGSDYVFTFLLYILRLQFKLPTYLLCTTYSRAEAHP